MAQVKITMVNDFELKQPTLIEGFPGVGLVGTIAASYIAEKLKMEKVGYIISDKFPPLAAVHNYLPLHPARIYQSKKHNLAVLFSEFTVPISAVYPLSFEIVNWAREYKVKQIYSLGGIAMEGGEGVYGIASTNELAETLKSKNVKLIREGATTGVSGVLLADCQVRGFPAASLLAEAKPDLMDPTAAARVLEKLKEIIGLDIDTKDLLSEAHEVESKMKEIIDNAKVAHEHYKKMDHFGTMYG